MAIGKSNKTSGSPGPKSSPIASPGGSFFCSKDIETVQDLIEEMQAEGTTVSSVWEYINDMNNKKMFAVFADARSCDIWGSPHVKNPKLIWTEGNFIGEYEHLN